MHLDDSFKTKLKNHKLDNFFYLAPITNAESIMKYGILSNNEVHRKKMLSKSFAEESVQERRDNKRIILTNNLLYNIHDLVPLYLTSRTPTLYARRSLKDKLFFVIIKSSILFDNDIEFAFSDGNAASAETIIYNDLNYIDKIPWDVINAKMWTDFDDGKRKRNAEFMIYPKIVPERFGILAVSNSNNKNIIEKIVSSIKLNIEVVVADNLFF